MRVRGAPTGRREPEPWLGGSPPDARDHIDLLTADNPAELDDFRAMDAVVSWPDKQAGANPWQTMDDAGDKAEEVKKEMFAGAEALLRDHDTFEDMMTGTRKRRDMQWKHDHEALGALRKRAQVFAAPAVTTPEMFFFEGKRSKSDHKKAKVRLTAMEDSSPATGGCEPVRERDDATEPQEPSGVRTTDEADRSAARVVPAAPLKEDSRQMFTEVFEQGPNVAIAG